MSGLFRGISPRLPFGLCPLLGFWHATKGPTLAKRISLTYRLFNVAMWLNSEYTRALYKTSQLSVASGASHDQPLAQWFSRCFNQQQEKRKVQVQVSTIWIPLRGPCPCNRPCNLPCRSCSSQILCRNLYLCRLRWTWAMMQVKISNPTDLRFVYQDTFVKAFSVACI